MSAVGALTVECDILYRKVGLYLEASFDDRMIALLQTLDREFLADGNRAAECSRLCSNTILTWLYDQTIALWSVVNNLCDISTSLNKDVCISKVDTGLKRNRTTSLSIGKPVTFAAPALISSAVTL